MLPVTFGRRRDVAEVVMATVVSHNRLISVIVSDAYSISVC